MLYVKYGFVDVPHAVTEQIHCYHWYAITEGIVVFQDVVGVGILSPKILAETQGFSLKPRFLQLYEHEFQSTVILLDLCTEVDAKHGYLVAAAIGVFVLAHFHFHHISLKQCREYGFGNTFVLHQIFEHGVIDGICNAYYHSRYCFTFITRR